MEYTKVSFKISPNTETLREILMAELAQLPYDSFEEINDGLNAYIPSSEFNEDDINSLQIITSTEHSITYTTEIIPDQNWNKTWEKHFFNPIVIENRCVVKSPFHTDTPPVEYNILIEPKMAFGTGHHETTGLMIKHILDMDFQGKTVLDMGCGTGILGILCAQKGAQKVTGIDIEEWAFNNANENITMNNIHTMEVHCGDASLLGKEQYDIILANINRNILLEDISKYVNVLKKEGILLLSGFYNNDLTIINEECSKHYLKKLSVKEDNNWVAVAYILTK
jgi:ribosomal protein L11 methyltransferase